MRYCLAPALLVLGLVAGVSRANTELLPERIAKTAQERIDAGTYQTLVFGLVDNVKVGVFTFGKLNDGKAPDGDTVYEIGSITKTFTATLLADAVLAGRFTLDTPVADLLPDFKIPDRNGKKITLGEIGTQHSGLPRLPANLLPKDPANPYADYDAEKLKAFLGSYQLPRDPGASYEYSNLAFGLLGYALGQSENSDYQTIVSHKIFQPLGMTMTGTKLNDEMISHLAPGHDESGGAAKNWDFDALSGAGAIRSTVNDMLRYLQANVGVGQSSLTKTMQFAQQPRKEMTANMRIGLAWMTTDKGIIWHSGGTAGYRSFIGFSPDGRKGVVILTNTEADVDDLGFATLLESAPLAPAHKLSALPSGTLDEYLGSYKLTEQLVLKISRDGDQLFGQATVQAAFPIFPSAKDEFFAKIGEITITFTRDDKGAVSGLVLHQHGDHTAPKLTAAQLPPEAKETALPPETLSEYVGQYQFSFESAFEITLKGDHLEAQLTGQPAAPIYPSAKDKFFYKIVDAQLDFERDATGKVVAVILHQNGLNPRAQRR
jgi:D-alanyl-D-alanine-carboxypeptidase/D-alanyl-D-alanine-endopeptidase